VSLLYENLYWFVDFDVTLLGLTSRRSGGSVEE